MRSPTSLLHTPHRAHLAPPATLATPTAVQVDKKDLEAAERQAQKEKKEAKVCRRLASRAGCLPSTSGGVAGGDGEGLRNDGSGTEHSPRPYPNLPISQAALQRQAEQEKLEWMRKQAAQNTSGGDRNLNMGVAFRRPPGAPPDASRNLFVVAYGANTTEHDIVAFFSRHTKVSVATTNVFAVRRDNEDYAMIITVLTTSMIIRFAR